MLTKKEFSIYLMDAWYNNMAGDWAKNLAITLQTEAEIEAANNLIINKEFN